MAEWEQVSIGDVCTLEKGQTGIAKAIPGKYPLVATGAKRKTCDGYQFDTKAVCIPLVSSTGHGKKTLNYIHYQEGKFALGTILTAVIPKDPNQLEAKFLHLYLSFFKNTLLVPLMRGAANVSLNQRDIKKVQIPLPSIAKQREIIARSTTLLTHKEQLSGEIAEQQTFLQNSVKPSFRKRCRAS